MTSSDADARTILIAGTASHVGKSTVAAGLCRVLSDRGVPVVPFKAQNMSNNARAVPIATDDDGGADDDGGIDGHGGVDDEAEIDGDTSAAVFGEIGVSQYVQARAARIPPTTDHNPVLLKPRGGGESQLVIDGVAVGHYAAGSYYDDHWERARTAALDAHDRLARAYDVVVAEGAGSIAEINLHDRDLANVELARHADAEILLVADIERGGVFASLVGTLALLPDDLRDRVAGAVITKFRGDRSLLTPGLEAFTDRTGVPILGVIPHEDPGLPEEDSVDLPPPGQRHVRGNDDSVAPDRSVTIAVVRLDHISNFTDLEPLAAIPGVRIAYVPPSSDLSNADAVVLPGTKNTVDDCRALHAADFGPTIRAFEGPVVGICGGYQLLGERLTNVDVEGVGATGDEAEEGDTENSLEGLGLLPVETRFRESKRVVETELRLSGVGPLAGVEGPVRGYEIHTGRTTLTAEADVAHGASISPDSPTISLPFSRPDEPATAELGAATESVLGTYLHGLFENDAVRRGFVTAVYEAAGRNPPDRSVAEADPADRAGALLTDWVDLDALDLL